MTYLVELLVEALRNLSRHKLRSFLTALGVIFGVASVMSMMSTGEGARRAILEQIQQLGIRNVIVNARKPPQSVNVQEDSQGWTLDYGLTRKDASQIASTVPQVEHVLTVRDVEKFIWFKSRRFSAKIRGVTPEYLRTLNLVPTLGRTLTDVDGASNKRVCVVRERLLREAGYLGDPLALDLKIEKDYYRVVGVLEDIEFQSPNRKSLGLEAKAFEVYVPYETVVERFGITQFQRSAGSRESTRVELHQIVCTMRSEEEVLDGARAIKTILERFHDKVDYEVIVPLELLESRQRTQRVFNIVMPIIAGISLLVGGIGILNIMLASITERTREIGIRRALGATGADITWQFLVETVTLAAVGGLLGVALGVFGVWLVREFTEWNAVITGDSVALSMGISCLTGVLFGLYPARRAALMDPIEALRHE